MDKDGKWAKFMLVVEINDSEVKSCLILKIINYLLCCSKREKMGMKLLK